MKLDDDYNQYREFCEFARQKNVIFYYVGYFSQNIITAMSEAVRLRLEQSGTAGPTRRKLFSSFVEMAQNIIHYSSETLTPAAQDDDEIRQGAVCIGKSGERYYLLCANQVATQDVDALREKLEPLKTMTLEEIKRAYQNTLRADLPEGSKGAGLGFLTVARDASEPLEFEFVPCAAGRQMFYLKATV